MEGLYLLLTFIVIKQSFAQLHITSQQVSARHFFLAQYKEGHWPPMYHSFHSEGKPSHSLCIALLDKIQTYLRTFRTSLLVSPLPLQLMSGAYSSSSV